jgi:hypothetical protein
VNEGISASLANASIAMFYLTLKRVETCVNTMTDAFVANVRINHKKISWSVVQDT